MEVPNSKSTKEELFEFLVVNDIQNVPEDALKEELVALVKAIVKEIPCNVDRILKEKNVTLLRLPPYAPGNF